jgi:sulfofructose kinase
LFHGAFCYAVLKGMSLPDTLEFSNAMAALNCTEYGARGKVGTLDEVDALIRKGERRSQKNFARRSQV